ncbi:transposase [Streptomyces sp. NPDC048496]|uniref:transposase n=1 Tax=Streptomyces sp. NPDC048496 TaxID=3365558 RepID=UPI00371FC46F
MDTLILATKDYADEFKADAVALYESTLGATYKGIAADLGISRGSLRTWVLRDRERRGVAGAAGPSGGRLLAGTSEPGSGSEADERIRRLEARVRELEVSERKLATERDILRKARSISPGRRTGELLPVR